MCKKITSFLFVFIFILLLVFIKPSMVRGVSMKPTLKSNDFILYLRTKNVSNGDIVILWNDTLDKLLVKRVIGTAGQEIYISNGKLYVDNVLQKEDYIKNQNWGKNDEVYETIKDGEIFVLGDNRNNSMDSRFLGAIQLSDVKGKVFCNVTKLTGATSTKIIVVLNYLKCFLTALIISIIVKNKLSRKDEVKE